MTINQRYEDHHEEQKLEEMRLETLNSERKDIQKPYLIETEGNEKKSLNQYTEDIPIYGGSKYDSFTFTQQQQ